MRQDGGVEQPHAPHLRYLCEDPECCDNGCPTVTCRSCGEDWPCPDWRSRHTDGQIRGQIRYVARKRFPGDEHMIDYIVRRETAMAGRWGSETRARKRLQAKHITTDQFLSAVRTAREQRGYACTFTVAEVLGLPWKVVGAKVTKLDHQGVIEGCGCGCAEPIWIVAEQEERLRLLRGDT